MLANVIVLPVPDPTLERIVIRTPNSYGSVVGLNVFKERESHPHFESTSVFPSGDHRSQRWSQLKLIYKFQAEIKSSHNLVDDSAAASKVDEIRKDMNKSMTQFVS